MSYPQYPQTPQPTDDTSPTQAELTEIYDKYSKVGLYLAPKQADKKVPHFYWWGKENRAIRRNRNEALEYQTHQNISGWCVVAGEHSHRLLVVDLDPSDIIANGSTPEQVYNLIQNLSSTKFVMRTPANGVHLYYRVPTGKHMLDNSAPPIKGVDVRGQGGQVVFVGGYNTYSGDYAQSKGVPDGHRATYSELVDGRYHEIPEMSDELYDWLTSGKPPKKKSHLADAKNYENTEQGSAKLEYHLKQPFEARERVVKEALMAALGEWDTQGATREEWLQLYMAAHHGSSGSHKIRDIILFHPNVRWSDGAVGRQLFLETWHNHEHRDGGNTVASLFYLARQSGWMLKTGLEIPDERVEEINVKYVKDWVDTQEGIPKRLLLQSQTGSGKTYNIKTLWERLGKPKTVIFVPTKKLAIELSQTLINEHGVPAISYRDTNTAEILTKEELLEAHVLVTTLQTFGSKVAPKMEGYGLVYIEESDQLLQQFSAGGNAYDASHVTDKQARQGFAVLRDAYEKSGVVWAVDAGLSMVTLTVAEDMYNGVVRVIRNTKVSLKAPVEVVEDVNSAYQKVLEALLAKNKVVFVADTAREAEGIEEIMRMIGALKGKKSIVITRNTENSHKVRRFMKDVNKEAAKYDLVSYNTVMASGVSIDKVVPDVVVQVCTYLPPRVNLQLLNRYREQKQVYLFTQDRENVYTHTAEDVLEEIKQRATMESHLSSMPVSTRVADAELRAIASSIATADKNRQWRSAKDFYSNLLREDGRVVTDVYEIEVMGRLSASVKAVKKLRKEQKDHIANTWDEVQPIDSSRPALEGQTPLDIAKGEVHATIEIALRGNIPYELDSEYVHDVAMHFKKYGFMLHAFMNQEVAIKKAEAYLGDGGRSLGNLRNNVTLIKLLAHVGKLFPDLSANLTVEMVADRAKEFNQAITLAEDAYNMVINRSKQKYAIVWERNETPEKRALAFSKILLSQLGLKQRSTRVSIGGEKVVHYHVANLKEAQDFILWRSATSESLVLDDSELQGILDTRKEVYGLFGEFSVIEQQAMLAAVDEFNDFVTVVKAKKLGELVW